MSERKSKDQKYDSSEKGKARNARYAKSAKGRARAKRYSDGPNGNAARVRTGTAYLGRVSFSKREIEGLIEHGKAD